MTEVPGAQVTACWGTMCDATQPSTFLGTPQKKSRAEVCFLQEKKTKTKTKNPQPQRPYKQQQGASDSEGGATIRSQPYGWDVVAIRHAMETMWIIFLMQLPSPNGLLSLASFPFSSLKHLFPDRKKAELPLPHDSPNPGCITSLPRRAFSITQNVSQHLSAQRA